MKETAQRRTRSFGGCPTCRTRRIKCDETRPSCTACLTAGLSCQGYRAKLRFVFYEPRPIGGGLNLAEPCKGKEESGSRQQLYTEDDRLATSLALTSKVGTLEVDAIIEQLGFQYREHQSGPFGVFSLNHVETPGSQRNQPPRVIESTAGEAIEGNIYGSDFDLDMFQPTGSFDDVDLANLCNFSTGEMENLPEREDQGFNFEDMAGDCLVTNSPQGSMLQDFLLANSVTDTFSPTAPLSVNPSVGLDQDCMSVVPSSSSYLLSHYKLQMGNLFSPIRVRKPIWGVLHLPSAMATFSELTVFGEASHAKSAFFYGLLAVSAFNLDKMSTESATTYWWATGERLCRKAKSELQQACNLELDGSKVSKYKDILMAVLNMITIAVVNAQQEEARSYLLNAELFMCARSALKTHHSRKAKMLHQIYLFLRIIEESTYIYPAEWKPVKTPSEKDIFPSMRFPSLRTHSLGQGRDLDALCGRNLEHCLLGQPCCTHKYEQIPLFSQVYGIPESLFSLISKTTALANEIAAVGTPRTANSLPNHLSEASQALEKEVCGWTNDLDDTGVSCLPDDNALPENRVYMPHFISAIHCATIILFYRRVYNLNPLLLQSQVETAIDHLVRTEIEKVNSAVVNTAIVWPGFIVAAEALSPALQERCEGWLRGCAASGGMRNFDLAADVARKVWKERTQRADPAFSWVDLVREKKLALVLT